MMRQLGCYGYLPLLWRFGLGRHGVVVGMSKAVVQAALVHAQRLHPLARCMELQHNVSCCYSHIVVGAILVLPWVLDWRF